MVAFSGFYESHELPPSGNARDSTAASRWPLKRPTKRVHFCIVVVLIVALAAGGAIGDTEQAVAGWRHSVASGEALVMLHRAMRSVSHRCTAMAIKMAHGGGTCVRRRHLFRLL